jgi:hypothetical protein
MREKGTEREKGGVNKRNTIEERERDTGKKKRDKNERDVMIED